MGARRERVLVVGAGLGGLSAAAGLAAAGFEVEVFEKNERIGGKLNLIERDGFRFDFGPSILILPHLFQRVFERAGRRLDDYVELVEIQPQWRSFFPDGAVVDLFPDLARMETELEKLGPRARGYWDFVEYSRRLYGFAGKAFFESGADTLGQVVRGHRWREIVRGAGLPFSVHEGVARRVEEPHLRSMLDFFVKYVGSSPYDAPAILNLMPYSQLRYGLWYVRGGFYRLAEAFGKLLAELGVKVHLSAQVTRILTRDRRAEGIVLADSGEERADAVVCNMEVIPAYERLLGERGAWLRGYRWRFEPAASGVVVHLGVNRRYEQLRHHNVFTSEDPRAYFDAVHRRKVLPEDPSIYLVCPTITDPSVAPEGHHIIKVLPHVPHLREPPLPRERYLEFKERLFDKLERMGLTDLRRHIVVEEVLTPHDLEQLFFSNRGAIYGVVSDRRKNLGFKAQKRSSRYRGLYFVGGSVNPGGGTPMAVLGGEHVARMVAEDLGRSGRRG